DNNVKESDRRRYRKSEPCTSRPAGTCPVAPPIVPEARTRNLIGTRLTHLLDSGGLPRAVKDRWSGFVRPIQPKHQDEFAVRCGEPVGFLLWTWIRRLKIQVH